MSLSSAGLYDIVNYPLICVKCSRHLPFHCDSKKARLIVRQSGFSLIFVLRECFSGCGGSFSSSSGLVWNVKCLLCHLRRLKMLFLLELLSALLRPMRSRAFSSSSCCWRPLSDFPSDDFPLRSEPEAGFRRSFSFIIWPTKSTSIKLLIICANLSFLLLVILGNGEYINKPMD